MQNFIEIDMKKCSDPKALTFGVWGLKTSLVRFGSKAFGKGLTKPSVKNPSSNQTRPHLLKNHEINPIKSLNLRKIIDLGGLGARNYHNYRTLASIFKSRSSFPQES